MSEAEIEKEIRDKGKTAARIIPEDIDATIIAESYFSGLGGLAVRIPPEPAQAAIIYNALHCLTICVLVLKNGYTVVGKSACASPKNFDVQLGKRIAKNDARQQIWALEGYILRSRLAAESAIA